VRKPAFNPSTGLTLVGVLLFASPGAAVPDLPPVSHAPTPTPPDAATGPAQQPYRHFADAGAGFWGPGREEPEPDPLPPTIKLGLFAPARGGDGRSAQQAAELALAEANRAGGYRGRPFELCFRPDDGPWGAATPRLVELANREGVWAAVGGLTGETAHLAELVAAKLWLPVVVTWAPDRTIDYANVPWVFRVAPDDGQQAELLLDRTLAWGLGLPLVLAAEHRDAGVALDRLTEAARRRGLPPPVSRRYSPAAPLAVLDELVLTGPAAPGAVLVWGPARDAGRVLDALARRGYTGLRLAPASLASGAGLAREGLVVAAPYDLATSTPAQADFARRYHARFGSLPEPEAGLAYDAWQVLLAAIGKGGLNRARIRDALAATRHLGQSGILQFSSLGGNPTPPVLVQARTGRWQRLPTERPAAPTR